MGGLMTRKPLDDRRPRSLQAPWNIHWISVQWPETDNLPAGKVIRIIKGPITFVGPHQRRAVTILVAIGVNTKEGFRQHPHRTHLPR